VDAGTPHHHQGRHPVLFLVEQGDGEEILPQIEMTLNPQIPLTQHDESCDVLDTSWIQVLQLNLVVVEQPPEEWMRRHHESTLMERHEGDDVAIQRRRCILAARHEPLRRRSPCAEKTAPDETLQVQVAHVQAVPQRH
jgi:hypothetical protein